MYSGAVHNKNNCNKNDNKRERLQESVFRNIGRHVCKARLRS